MAEIRQVRLLLEQRDGLLRKAAKLSFVRDGRYRPMNRSYASAATAKVIDGI